MLLKFIRKNHKITDSTKTSSAVPNTPNEKKGSSEVVPPEITSRVNKNCSSFVVDMNTMVSEFDKIQALLMTCVNDAKNSAETAEGANIRVTSNEAIVEKLQHLINELRFMNQNLEQVDTVMQNVEKTVYKIRSLGKRIQLVSFNASIEAARAGRHGRGFAVVASEVQDLAHQSEEALKGITEAVVKGRSFTGQVISGVSELMETSQPIIDKTLTIFREIAQDVRHMASQTHGLADTVKSQIDKIKVIGDATKRKVEDFNRSTSDLIGDMCGVRIQHLNVATVRENLGNYHIIDVRPQISRTYFLKLIRVAS